MKVLILTPWYPHERNSSSGVFIKSQAKALSKRHEVTVVFATVDYATFSFSSSHSYVSVDNLINEYRIIVNKSILLFNQLNYLVIIILKSWRIAKSFRPDVIHAHVGYPTAFWAWSLAKLMGVPFVLTEHTRPVNSFRSFIHKRLTIFGMKRADALVAVSNMLSREIKEYVSRPVVVVPNVVETKQFSVSDFPKSEVIQIGFLGTLNKPVKGLDILLKACQKLKVDFTLHIGGRGVLLEEYKRLSVELGISSKCKFYGFVPVAEVPHFMSRLHFFVCSSRSETFCVALAEAIASGRPVVSTKCGGPEDFVNASNGILVNVEDVDSLLIGIEQLMGTYQNFDRLKINKEMSDLFSGDRFVEKVGSVYRMVLNAY
jgi:L-malate glycosyltransferase